MSAFIIRQIFGVVLALILMAVWPGFNLGLYAVGWLIAEGVRVIARQEQQR